MGMNHDVFLPFLTSGRRGHLTALTQTPFSTYTVKGRACRAGLAAISKRRTARLAGRSPQWRASRDKIEQTLPKVANNSQLRHRSTTPTRSGRAIAEVMSIGTEATVKKFVLHRIAIIVAAIAISTEALALAAGWGRGHGGGGLGAGHFGELGGSHFGGAMNGGPLGGRGEPHFAGGLHHRSWFREANITAVGRRN
jgi:hypothetical protein